MEMRIASLQQSICKYQIRNVENQCPVQTAAPLPHIVSHNQVHEIVSRSARRHSRGHLLVPTKMKCFGISWKCGREMLTSVARIQMKKIPFPHFLSGRQMLSDTTEFKRRGDAAFEQKDFLSAVQLYSEGIPFDAENPAFYCARSAAFSALGNHDEALSDARYVIALRPMEAQGYSRLAAAFQAQDRMDDALEALREGLRANPALESLKAEIATIQLRTPGRGPDTLNAAAILGGVKVPSNMRDFIHSITTDRANVARFQSDPRLLLVLRSLSARLRPPERASHRPKAKPGRWADYISLCRDHIAHAEADRDVLWRRIAAAQLQLGQIEDACASLTESLLQRDDYEVACELARLQNFARARRSAAYQNADSAEKARREAAALRDAGRLGDALQKLREAVRRAPNDPAILIERATAFIAAGEWALALHDCEAALALRPGAVEGLRMRAECRMAAGDLAGAREAWCEVLEIDENDEKALEGMKRVEERRRLALAPDTIEDEPIGVDTADPDVLQLLPPQ
jgi:tetratricopeptide (TPR) repeat protein